MTYKDAKWELLSICEMQCDDARCEDCFVKVATEAVEKQIPKKPLHSGVEYDCPYCLGTVGHITPRGRVVMVADHHCECGQAIDWGNE